MKTVYTLLLFVPLLISCTSDDSQGDTTLELNGIWNLIHVTCLCEPGNYEVGDHVWTFKLAENELEVINNVEDDLQILATGTYTLEQTETTLSVDGMTFDYYFENDTLYLEDMPELDGPRLTFVSE